MMRSSHMLQQAGIDIARRTVAKYRESLGIPSSVQRRRETVSKAAAMAVDLGPAARLGSAPLCEAVRPGPCRRGRDEGSKR